MPDQHIASVLNRAGKVTGKGLSWNRSRVCRLRNTHNIDVYREGERQEREEVTLDEATEFLKVSPSTVRRLINTGMLAARQDCEGAPWIIRKEDIENENVQKAAAARRARRPAPHNPQQKVMDI